MRSKGVMFQCTGVENDIFFRDVWVLRKRIKSIIILCLKTPAENVSCSRQKWKLCIGRFAYGMIKLQSQTLGRGWPVSIVLNVKIQFSLPSFSVHLESYSHLLLIVQVRITIALRNGLQIRGIRCFCNYNYCVTKYNCWVTKRFVNLLNCFCKYLTLRRFHRSGLRGIFPTVGVSSVDYFIP